MENAFLKFKNSITKIGTLGWQSAALLSIVIHRLKFHLHLDETFKGVFHRNTSLLSMLVETENSIVRMGSTKESVGCY